MRTNHRTLGIVLSSLIASTVGAEVIHGPFEPGSGHWNLVPNGDFESGSLSP